MKLMLKMKRVTFSLLARLALVQLVALPALLAQAQQYDEFLSVVESVDLAKSSVVFEPGSLDEQLPSYRFGFDSKIYFRSGEQAVLNSVKPGHVVSVVVNSSDGTVLSLMIRGMDN